MRRNNRSSSHASGVRFRNFSRLKRNRRGIELSINFVVMLIMAVSMFIGGLVFAAKFFKQAETVRGSLSSQTEKQLERLLDSGSPVVIPINTKEIYRSKYDSFAMGILSKDNGKYYVDIKVNSAFKKDKSSISAKDSALGWLQYNKEAISLKKNEKGKMVILVDVPSGVERGTYIYQVSVRFVGDDPAKSMDPYDAPLQMIVKVP